MTTKTIRMNSLEASPTTKRTSVSIKSKASSSDNSVRATAWLEFDFNKNTWEFLFYENGESYKNRPIGRKSAYNSHKFEYYCPLHGTITNGVFDPDLINNCPATYMSRGGRKGYMPITQNHPGMQQLREFLSEATLPKSTPTNTF